MKRIFLILAALILFQFFSTVSASEVTHDFDMTTSILESKKKKRFLKAIEVFPHSFQWEGNDVEIDECWQEKSPKGTAFVIFRLKANGKNNTFNKIAWRNGLFLRFVQETKNPEVDHLGHYKNLSSSQKLRSLLHPVYGEYIRYFKLTNPVSEDIQLRAITDSGLKDNEEKIKSVSTDIVLTFRFSSKP